MVDWSRLREQAQDVSSADPVVCQQSSSVPAGLALDELRRRQKSDPENPYLRQLLIQRLRQQASVHFAAAKIHFELAEDDLSLSKP
jgi:hypothetical protein